MRRFLGLVGALAFPLIVGACEKKVIIQQAPSAGETTDGGPAATTGDAGGLAATSATDPLVIDLGTIASNTDVPFTIPEGALGFNAYIDGDVKDFDQNAPMGIQRITDPNGKVVLDDFTPAGGSSPTATAEFDTIATAEIPQGEDTHPVAGIWKLRVAVQNATTRSIKVAAKVRVQSSGDGTFHGGTLELHLHVPDGLKIGTTTIQGADAATSPDVKLRVDKFYALVSQMLGLDRGDVVYHPEGAALSVLDGDQAVLQGFAASAGSTDGKQELHILYTNEIGENGKPIAVGLSPGIPGAATVFGRGVSTILIQTSADSDFDSLAMVHETGHFMGLNHTTEFSGAVGDPLSDTPLCTAMTAASPQLSQMKQCPDRRNIMFPATAIEAPIELSPEQILVYHGSPIYRAATTGGTKTQSLVVSDAPQNLPTVNANAPLKMRATFRISGAALSPLEEELSLGICGLNKIDAAGLVQRYGVTRLRAAAADPDLRPFMRGRAAVALERLGY